MKARPANTVSSDSEAPVVKTQDITRSLLGGTVSITAAEVDNGSADNWGIASLALDKTDFSCRDIGSNQVVLTRDRQGGQRRFGISRRRRCWGRSRRPQVAVTGRVGQYHHARLWRAGSDA